MKRSNWLVAGLAGGAAGTTALNAVTYLDMAVRGRPSSSTPEQMVQELAEKVGVDIPGSEGARRNRLAGLGPLSGLAVGVGVGSAMGLAHRLGLARNVVVSGVISGAAAMVSTDASMAALRVSRPSDWSIGQWLSDAVPHLAYGLVTAAVIDAMEGA